MKTLRYVWLMVLLSASAFAQVTVTATIPQYGNGNYFIQAVNNNQNQVSGNISNTGQFSTVVIANTLYGITITPPNGSSFSRFGTTFTSVATGTQDISTILEAAIPPPVSSGISAVNATSPLEATTTLGVVALSCPSCGAGGAGTVTHTTGALNSGSMMIGNGGADIKSSPVDFGVTQAGSLTTPAMLINGGAAGALDGLIFQAQSSNADQTGFVLQNSSVAGGNGIAAVATGSNSSIRSYLYVDLITGAEYFGYHAVDATHANDSMMAGTTLGWSSGSTLDLTGLDTGLSRDSAGVVDVGNGVNKNTSGSMHFRNLTLDGTCAGCGGGSTPAGENAVQASSPDGSTLIQASPAIINSSLGLASGFFSFGDSISCNTGASPASDGFVPLLRNKIGGVFTPACQSGDMEADQNFQHIFPGTNPIGSGLDPLYTHETFTNDSIVYGANTNQEQIAQRLRLGSDSWLANIAANKILGQAGTTTGTCAADNTTQNLTAVACTSSGATVSFPITTTIANQGVYVWYSIVDGGTGTFNLKLDGTNVNDPFNGTAIFAAFGDGGALIQTQNGTTAGIAGVRIVAPAAGSHTISIATLSAASVSIFGLGVSPAVTSTLNPYVIEISPNHQNSANDATSGVYAGFVQSITSTLAADHMNVIYSDTRDALGTNFATFYADTIHPNDAGHALMATTTEAVIPSSLLTQNFIPTQSSIPSTYNFADSVNPMQYWSPNPLGSFSPHGWGRGILWEENQGLSFFTSYLNATGITVGFPNDGGPTNYCIYAYNQNQANNSARFPASPPQPQDCYFAITGNGGMTFNVNVVSIPARLVVANLEGGSPFAISASNASAEINQHETITAQNFFNGGVGAYGAYNDDLSAGFVWGAGGSTETNYGVSRQMFFRDTINNVTIGKYNPVGTLWTLNGLTNATLTGPATEPTGACTTNGMWVFSQDGAASFCNGTTWVQKIAP